MKCEINERYMNKYFLHEMYDQRKNFVIVALTGITGSGCSDFAELMAKPFKSWASESICPRCSR